MVLSDIGRRAAARLWYAKKLADGGAIPYARDEPTVVAGEGPVQHVLLIGNGAAHGWGVSSHRLALCGQLAESLSARTGQAVEVHFIGAELMSAESAPEWLGDHDLAHYAAVVVVMGMNDAVRLTPVESWERSVGELVARLRAGLRHGAPIVLTGIQPVASVPAYSGLFAAAGQQRADELNLATRRFVAATPGTAFVALSAPEVDPERPYGSPLAYRGWADTITTTAAPLLDEQRSGGAERRRARVPAQRWRWPAAPALLDAAADRGTPELRRLVNAAKIEFGVTLAVVTLLEGDRMWFAAASADTPVVIPARLSYDVHVPGDRPLVVPDADHDARFQDNPFIAQSHLPFYVGHPIHDLRGRMIGTFCVLAAHPRPAATVRLEVLENYALAAERELHRLEHEAEGAVTV
jgi:GAF domain-containing protein